MPEVDHSCAPGSRIDFLHALEILGKKLSSQDCRFELGDQRFFDDLQGVVVRCPYDLWLEVFGEPRSIEHHGDSVPLLPVQVWLYECTDGPIECVGQQVDDMHGERWVAFERLCYF